MGYSTWHTSGDLVINGIEQGKGLRRAQAELLTDAQLRSVLDEANAELVRRNLVIGEQQLQKQRDSLRTRQADGWRGFSNFLLGAIHALSAHRMLQRHVSQHGKTFAVGIKEPAGSYWTPVEIAMARRAYAASPQRKKDKDAGYLYTDLAPWERIVYEHRAVMLKKLEIEKAQAVKPEPVKVPYINTWRSFTP